MRKRFCCVEVFLLIYFCSFLPQATSALYLQRFTDSSVKARKESALLARALPKPSSLSGAVSGVGVSADLSAGVGSASEAMAAALHAEATAQAANSGPGADVRSAKRGGKKK